jgi:hypothetical protein
MSSPAEKVSKLERAIRSHRPSFRPQPTADEGQLTINERPLTSSTQSAACRAHDSHRSPVPATL